MQVISHDVLPRGKGLTARAAAAKFVVLFAG